MPPDATPGVMTWEELLTHMDNLSSWGHSELKAWTKTVGASALQTNNDEQACFSQDLKRRAQLQNKLASVCEDMCKEVGAYPKCSQCPNFVPPDATPGVMTWEELLTHMDNLVDWGRDSLKGWKKPASALQLGRNATGNATNGTDLTVASDRHYEGFKEEWHKEWRRGDFPSWKETQTTAWMDNSYNRYQPKDYVDSQSDGKPSPALIETQACTAEDLKRRAQLQNKLASVCEDMCKEVGAYPKGSQCPAFVPPDATPGVMPWEELLTHMDNLSSWGHSELKAWTKTAGASALQTNNDEQACTAADLKRRAQVQNKLASVCEDMCKEVGAYPKCSQCPAFVPPDAT